MPSSPAKQLNQQPVGTFRKRDFPPAHFLCVAATSTVVDFHLPFGTPPQTESCSCSTPRSPPQRSKCCRKPIMIKTLSTNSTQLTPRHRRLSPLSEPMDCKCSAVHHGSNRCADGLCLSLLIHAEWLGHYT